MTMTLDPSQVDDRYPRVAWSNPSDGLRVVEFYDEEQRKVCSGLETLQGNDLMGNLIWHRANASNVDQMETLVRYFLRSKSQREPSLYYGRSCF